MALLWGTNYLQNTLPESLLDRFDEIKSDPHDKPGPDRLGTLPLYNGKTGELVVKIPGGVAVRVNREKLRKYLATDIEINVRIKITPIWFPKLTILLVWQNLDRDRRSWR